MSLSNLPNFADGLQGMSVSQSKREISFERKDNVPGPGSYTVNNLDSIRPKTASVKINPNATNRSRKREKDSFPGPG